MEFWSICFVRNIDEHALSVEVLDMPTFTIIGCLSGAGNEKISMENIVVHELWCFTKGG